VVVEKRMRSHLHKESSMGGKSAAEKEERMCACFYRGEGENTGRYYRRKTSRQAKGREQPRDRQGKVDGAVS